MPRDSSRLESSLELGSKGSSRLSSSLAQVRSARPQHYGEMWLKEGRVRKEHLEEVVEETEKELRMRVERCNGRRKWESSKQRWWDTELEEKRKQVREWEKRWEEGRKDRVKEEVRIERKEYRGMIERKKTRYWMEYVGKMRRGEGFGFVKMDRDFMVDLPVIGGEDGVLVREDMEKGRAIVWGLGKREELKQEKEGLWEEVILEKVKVKEAVYKQRDGKAAGVNRLSGRVMK